MNPEDSVGIEPIGLDLDHVATDDEFDDEFEDNLDDGIDENALTGDVPAEVPAADRAAPTVALATLPVTGEPRVDDALARLADLSALPVDEHVGVFEDVQRRLHDTLADLTGQS